MDPRSSKRAITPRTKAIMPVHLYGQLADMERIWRSPSATALPVIEDAAQAHGAEHGGSARARSAISAASASIPARTSAPAAKAVRSSPIARISRIGAHAARLGPGAESTITSLKGFNYRMDGIQAAILRVKLRLPRGLDGSPAQAAARYNALLAGSGIPIPARRAGPDTCITFMRSGPRPRRECEVLGAGHSDQHPLPDPGPSAARLRGLGYGAGEFPIPGALADETLSLPMFPEIPADGRFATPGRVTARSKA